MFKKLMIVLTLSALLCSQVMAADSKVSDLAAPAGGVDPGDLLLIVDAPLGSPISTADTVQNAVDAALAAPGDIGGDTPKAGAFTSVSAPTINITNAGNLRVTTATTAHEFSIQAYDVDGTAWIDMLHFVNGNSPTATALGTWDFSGATVSLPAISGYLNAATRPVVIGNCEGTQDGGSSETVMTDGGESLTVDAYIGMTVYNTTDSTSCTVTDNAGTTITCAAGSAMDWDNTDTWSVGPGPNQAGSVFYVDYGGTTTILHPATIGYSACYTSIQAQNLTVDPAADAMTINLNTGSGYTDLGAGDELDSDDVDGSEIWIHNQSTTEAYTHGRIGTWSDGGAT